MSRSLVRGLIRGTLTLAVVATATVAGGTVAQAATPRITISALSFAESTVDATAGPVTNVLTFTVKNTEPEPFNLGGTVTLRMRSTVTGEFLGHERVARFDYDYSYGEIERVSGTLAEATFAYHVPVRRYSDSATATWEVTEVDLYGSTVRATVGRAKLSTFPGYRFTVHTLLDASAPTFDHLDMNNGRQPYFYVKDEPSGFGLTTTIYDGESGFWKGSAKIVGPGGQSVTAPITWGSSPYSTALTCGGMGSGDDDGTRMPCNIDFTFPVGTNPGSWRVAQIVLFNNAGGRATFKNPAAPSLVVTSNSTLSASDFVVDPNPVDNWRGAVTVELSMAVTGASRGISQLDVDFSSGCDSLGQPYTRPDGRLAIQVRVDQGYWYFHDCELTNLVLRDGAGNLALYGDYLAAPDPQISIESVPSTEPPTALSATFDPASIPHSELQDRVITLTVLAENKVAPVSSMPVYIYDADGNIVYQSSGGSAQQAADGTLTDYLRFSPWEMEPGDYTLGFELFDRSGLRSYWNMPDVANSNTLPGGPVVLRITEG
ncbi:hypothetical protein O7635_13890 [Asanoa sp. WMMD1127]|uniref:hypothetical protein n=1 Tax=Asanoa sp. WMMD1127 TaxID=3016107 RepID=UPI0024169A32|nr:hypothetical protein [Asanoa sp. WMMD1127]MDG4822940.1 hypothetical protein [Asanoa sp. WMMD1127]